MAVPDLAAHAYERARQGGFGLDGPTLSSRPGTGALLAVLAATRRSARIAELGTGLGAAAAWIAAGMDADSRLVTVESNVERAQEARSLLSSDPRIEVLAGRWEELVPPRGPFDLVFVDSGFSRRLHEAQAAAFLLDIVVPGGILVMDDLTPESESHQSGSDPKREFALANPRVIGAELYPPGPDGTLGGVQSGLLVMTKLA
jgi:predicted O-methyltransferase YrrM